MEAMVGDTEHAVGRALSELRVGVADAAKLPTFGIADDEILPLVESGYALLHQVHALVLGLVEQADSSGVPRRGQHLATVAWLTHSIPLAAPTAKRDVALAGVLTRRPNLASAMASGSCSPEQAVAVVRAVDELPSDAGPDARAAVEEVLLGETDRHGPAMLTRIGRAVRERLYPDRSEALEAQRLARLEADAHERRYLRWHDDGYGSTYGSFRVPLDDAARIRAVLDPLAAPQPSTDGVRDVRAADQRQADALLELVRLASAAETVPTNGGDRPRVVVTIDHRWLRDELGHAGLLDTGADLSPAAARRLACDADILPAVLGAQSEILDVGRSKRLFAGPLRWAVMQRDRHCLHPGCTRPPRWCDVHHVVPWHRGGTTCLANAALLCGVHHRLYDDGDWTFVSGDRGPTHVIPPPYHDVDQTPIPIRRE